VREGALRLLAFGFWLYLGVKSPAQLLFLPDWPLIRFFRFACPRRDSYSSRAKTGAWKIHPPPLELELEVIQAHCEFSHPYYTNVASLDRNEYSIWEIELELAARCDRSPSKNSQAALISSRSNSFRKIIFERLQVSKFAHFLEKGISASYPFRSTKRRWEAEGRGVAGSGRAAGSRE
jgi:hypothetical protein